MLEDGWLAQQFESNRAHLKSVAYRMLGSMAEAEDAVQEGWLRLNRSDAAAIDNLGGWLTTVVARICMDMLRARKVRPEAPVDAEEIAAGPEGEAGPDAERLLADSMGPALMVVLEHLSPAERVAFVLHDLFAIPFEDVAGILGRTPEATRQLASRARRRIQGRAESGSGPETDRARSQRVVAAFLAAARNGDFDALLAALHPDAVLRADALAVQVAAARAKQGAPLLASEIRGAKAVAETLKGRAGGASRALIDGIPGAVWVQGGQVRSVFVFTLREDRIVSIDLAMDPARLSALKVEILP